MNHKNDIRTRRPGLRLAALAALLLLACLAQAQPRPPDAGRLERENLPPPAPPRAAPGLQIQPPAPGDAPDAGGAQVTLSAIRLEGLDGLLAADTLTARLGPVEGRSFDLAGLRGLAAQVTQALREAGYPFARAWLPPQDLAGGILRIAVLPGRYGQVHAGDPRAEPWLAPLRPGEPITAALLERQLLLLSDLPGMRTQPVLRPGEAVGAGDLDAGVAQARGRSGELVLDNHGNRYAGRERLGGALALNSLAAFGDQLQLAGNVSREGTWQGVATYSIPLGAQGWTGLFSLSRTSYELGKEFASLDAQGTADTVAAGLGYPVLRSQGVNLRLATTLQHRRLHDERGVPVIQEARHSNALVLAASGDLTHGAGVTWGQASITAGRLDLDGALQAIDAATARAGGSFSKLNADVARLQPLTSSLTLYARFSGQWASQNLDSSEKLVLGGATGVRAWPSGEATGDVGWLAQVELRWRTGNFEPFAFVDGGSVRINREPWLAVDNTRGIAGAGLGLRFGQGPWALTATVAWRAGGDAPQTEPNAGQPQAWMSLAYRF